MNDKLLLTLVTSRMDEETLADAKKVPSWLPVINSLAQNQHWWFQRLGTLGEFGLEWRSTENWHQVYNILALTKYEPEPEPEPERTRSTQVIKPVDKSNPFHHTDVLAENDYNATAIRVLLELGYDPTVNSGQVLLDVARDNRLQVAEMLLARTHNFDNDAMESSLGICVFYRSIEVLGLLLDVIQVQGLNHLAPIDQATRMDNVRTFEVLLHHPNTQESYSDEEIFVTACVNGSINIVSKMLEDELIDLEKTGPRALDEACFSDPTFTEGAVEPSKKHIAVVSLLLSRPEVYKFRDKLVELIEACLNRTYINLLLQSRALKIDQIRSDELSNIEDIVFEDCLSSITGARNLSGSRPQIKYCNSFSECHYDMLLREIILKRLDMSYYLEWLLEHSTKSDTSLDVKRLILRAARSLYSTEPVVHDSPLFTAYSGFFLLVNSSDGQAIINTLKLEVEHSETMGASTEGLKLAGLLVGAYLGDDGQESA